MNTQVCLLSGELMPNVIGVLHTRAARVLPVVSRETEPQVDAFGRALRAAGSPAELLSPVRVLPFDLEDCGKTLRKAVGTLSAPEINWTAGTKIMSYAARRLAEELRLPALYVNTASRQILREDLAGDSRQSELIDSTRLGLNVLVHITANGHQVEGAETIQGFRARCTPAPALVEAATLIMDARDSEKEQLHRLAKHARNSPVRPLGVYPDFLRALVAARLIQPAARDGEYFLGAESLLHPFHLQSPQEQNAVFLTSTYLEVFLWSQIKERSDVDDVAWHVVLNPGVKGRVAELDIAMASESRLLFLECKSNLDLGRVADVIEEQFARSRRFGRLFGRWMLYIHRYRASYESPGAADIIASQEKRAGDYSGQLLWRDDLENLHKLVADFVKDSKPVF